MKNLRMILGPETVRDPTLTTCRLRARCLSSRNVLLPSTGERCFSSTLLPDGKIHPSQTPPS